MVLVIFRSAGVVRQQTLFRFGQYPPWPRPRRDVFFNIMLKVQRPWSYKG